MKPEEFDRAVSKGEIGPLYYVCGDEPYLVDRAVKRLLAKAVPDDFRDFNFNLFYGKECKGQEIVEAAETLPMFAARRVVHVRRAGDLPPEAMERLTGYIENPSPSTCLVFQGEKPDQRKKFFTLFKKMGEIVELKRPYDNQLESFIRDEAAALGKKVEAAVPAMLVYLVGVNLQELVSQLEKVCAYAGERELIRADDVREIVSDTKVDSVFELANALGAKRLDKSLRNLDTITRSGEHPLMVLSMMTRHFRQLWTVRELLDNKTPQAEIAKASGINPYFLKGVLEQARNFRPMELKRIFEKILATDLALKSGAKSPGVLMECLLMDICTVK